MNGTAVLGQGEREMCDVDGQTRNRTGVFRERAVPGVGRASAGRRTCLANPFTAQPTQTEAIKHLPELWATVTPTTQMAGSRRRARGVLLAAFFRAGSVCVQFYLIGVHGAPNVLLLECAPPDRPRLGPDTAAGTGVDRVVVDSTAVGRVGEPFDGIDRT
ncbi:hypothetical protein NZD89_13585 [Alicyclobacillus fastidiosus]|uniref:Uncharacterized protein n=1 Tax=Alicyclobacillus fastidiosus TaxID=392011 RepID=A0ABY6ZMZ3_9BACL|nr:hypothetical protein [Alicyclobacillus fastidiosus]WAH44323.1 hypothetical protein NZD89_13585 [Alicyclobacillus fastidiosus]